MKAIYIIPTGIIVSILWTMLLFKIGQSKKKVSKWFYPLLYAPLVISAIMYLAGPATFAGLFGLWIMVTILAVTLERFIWGITLKKVSGEDKMGWFFVIMYLPIFGWMIYYITE